MRGQATKDKLIEKYCAMSHYELKAASEGYFFIAGIDEAGRGPLAGPVVAAACILDPEKPVYGVDDSKKLSPLRRAVLYDEIVSAALAYSIIRIEHDEIDVINILNATKKAMRLCVSELASSIKPDILLIDAVNLEGTGIRVEPIIKGDTLSVSIAAASILAKTARDRIMEEYSLIYPQYGFALHKGYGTSAHYAAINNYGISPIHRKSFLKGLI